MSEARDSLPDSLGQPIIRDAASLDVELYRESVQATDSQIRQANALAKSSQELDLLEKRLLLIAMSRINSTDTELLTHRIYMHELTEVFGENPYARAKRAAEGLLRRVVHVARGNNSYDQFQWTTLARYVSSASSDTGESYIEIRLNEELSPYLLELRDRYNVIPLLDVLPLQSFNAQRLYEILWHDSHAMRKQFLTYDLKELKWELGLRTRKTERGKTVWVEKYKNWRDFRKLLLRAQSEFEVHGRLSFEFEPITHGRVTRQIRFQLSYKEGALPYALPSSGRSQAEVAVADELYALGYTQDPFRLIDEHGIDVVTQAIRMGNRAHAASQGTRNPLTNLPGFVRHLLTSGMARDSLRAESTTQVAVAVDPVAISQTILEAFDNHRKESLVRLWETLPEEVKDRTPSLLRLDLEVRNPFLYDTLERTGWEGPSYTSALNTYLLRNHSDSLDGDVLDVGMFAESRGYLKGLGKALVKQVTDFLEKEAG